MDSSAVAPVWVRGLKQGVLVRRGVRKRVAPVWVRGLKLWLSPSSLGSGSRTRMGAWIETCVRVPVRQLTGVAPVWVRGLKPGGLPGKVSNQVAPVWVRGLKRHSRPRS